MKTSYLLLAFGLCCCHGEKPTDHQQVVENYRSGKRQYVYSTRDGKVDGTYTWYAESGTPLMVENYVAGLKQGKALQYDSSGWLKSESFYVDDALNGPVRFFYPDGTVQREGTLLGKQFTGIEKEYYSTGQLHWVRNNSTSPIKATEYFRNGHRRMAVSIVDNEFQGPAVIYDSVSTDSVPLIADHGKFRRPE